MNKFLGIGYVTKKPEVRYANEKAVARFSLGISRRTKDAGVDFINCVAFGKTAEFIEKYFDKGMKMVVEGSVRTGSYEKDGRKIYTTDIVVDTVEFGESKNNSANAEKNLRTQSLMMDLWILIQALTENFHSCRRGYAYNSRIYRSAEIH